MKRLLFPNGESKVRSNPLDDLQETTDNTLGSFPENSTSSQEGEI